MQEQGRVMKRRNPFVQIDRELIDDDRLSWKATGLMTYFVSKPDNWIFYMDHIIKSKADGEKSVRSGIKELKEAGYIVRVAFRKNGKVSNYEFFIYEEPVKNPSNKDIHIDIDLWNEYLEEHKDDDLIDVTEAAIVIKKKKKEQVSRNRKPEKNKGVEQVSQKGKPEENQDIEQVSGFEEAEKEEAENAGLSIINSINLESSNNYDDDVEYQSLQILFVGAGGQPIKKHETHYQTYKQALQTIGSFQRMIDLANKYIVACNQGYHSSPQIVWFLSDGWRNFLTPVVKKMVRKVKLESPLPKAMTGKLEIQLSEQELAATYDDISATLDQLRNRSNPVLHQGE